MSPKAIKEKVHAYITRDSKISGGEPIIQGTRISVRLIAKLGNSGNSVDDIVALYPHLNHTQVHDALSYYYDNKEDIQPCKGGTTNLSLICISMLVFVSPLQGCYVLFNLHSQR